VTGGKHQAAGTAVRGGPGEPRTPVWDPARNPPAMSARVLTRQAPPPPVVDEALFDRPPARRRRRVLIALTYALLAAAVVSVGLFVRDHGGDHLVVPPAPAAASQASPEAIKPTKTARAKNSAGTSGSFSYLTTYGPVLGSAGPIRRFHVGVEKPAAAPAAFAAEIDRALGDHRSWIAARRFRLRRVPSAEHAEFTIYLASARTSERMCRAGGGLETGGYTSCRVPRQVIINDDRWESAIRGYGAPLATYRAYAINHEVGHQLGHGHQPCPGKGRLAPVMMQQTFGLKGCVANPWPYP
jgi:hypothetical protein